MHIKRSRSVAHQVELGTDLEADREVASTLADLIIGGQLVTELDDQADAPYRANDE